jgi:hypothetical protein
LEVKLLFLCGTLRPNFAHFAVLLVFLQRSQRIRKGPQRTKSKLHQHPVLDFPSKFSYAQLKPIFDWAPQAAYRFIGFAPQRLQPIRTESGSDRPKDSVMRIVCQGMKFQSWAGRHRSWF